MLENIKLLLNITDDKHDNIIELYISKIEYNVGEAIQTSVGATLTDTDKEFLNQYRKARCF